MFEKGLQGGGIVLIYEYVQLIIFDIGLQVVIVELVGGVFKFVVVVDVEGIVGDEKSVVLVIVVVLCKKWKGECEVEKKNLKFYVRFGL